MALTSASFSLRGGLDAAHPADGKTQAAPKRSAILLNLNEQVLRDLQQCCQHEKVVQLLGGKSPKIRYGSKTLDLNVRPDAFRHEIYSANNDSNANLDFTALVSHEAHVKTTEHKTDDDTAGADAALAALKQSLASMAKEKEARKVTITNSVIPNTKNARLYHRQSNNPMTRPSTTSSLNSTSHHGAPPTSAPHQDQHVKAQEKGMRTALIHLLAVAPATEQDLHSKTHIPNSHLSSLLPKIADRSGTSWELNNKAFREIDPWNFKYPNADQRQAAIDHAIRAFDRTRVPKDDKLWQILLPKDERGTGKVLSRLHLGVERRGDQLGTPALASTPYQKSTDKLESTAATPMAGSVSTPRNGAVATGRSAAGISIEKRLREAQKKQNQEKKKSKKDKEVAVADKETKASETKPRQAMAKRLPPKRISEKIKSAEIVHDSDDEEGEIINVKAPQKRDTPVGDSHKALSKPKPSPVKPSTPAISHVKSAASLASKAPVKAATEGRPVQREKVVEGTTAVRKTAPLTGTTSVNKAKGGVVARPAPSERPAKSSQTTAASGDRQVSPSKDTKPKVPSPLGTTKPRNASEEAELRHKQPISTKSTKPVTSGSVQAKTSQQAARASFFGDSTGRPGPIIKKRPLERADGTGEIPRKASKLSASSTAKPPTKEPVKPTATTHNQPTRVSHEGSVKRPANVTPAISNSDAKLKRKANDISSGIREHEVPAPKHRKTDSSSTHSVDHTNSSLTSLTTAPTASPESNSPQSPAQQASPSSNPMDVIQMFLNDSEASPKTQSTWEAALDKAAKFRTQLYPAYIELYDKLEAMAPEEVDEEDRRALFMMHSKLKAFKKDIYDAVG